MQSAEEASSSGSRPNPATDSRDELGPDEVEITDEFGRTRRISKKSGYYKQYKVGDAVCSKHKVSFLSACPLTPLMTVLF